VALGSKARLELARRRLGMLERVAPARELLLERRLALLRCRERLSMLVLLRRLRSGRVSLAADLAADGLDLGALAGQRHLAPRELVEPRLDVRRLLGQLLRARRAEEVGERLARHLRDRGEAGHRIRAARLEVVDHPQ